MLAEQMVSFTTFDRCDRCMAQAHAQADKAGFTELLFCNHHAEEFKDGLLNDDWQIRWDTV